MNWRDRSHPFGPPWTRHRRFIFWRFMMIFGGMAVFFLTALGLILYLLLGQGNGGYSPVGLIAILCGLPLVFMLGASLLSGLAFRRLGTPFADIMSATDAAVMILRIDDVIASKGGPGMGGMGGMGGGMPGAGEDD